MARKPQKKTPSHEEEESTTTETAPVETPVVAEEKPLEVATENPTNAGDFSLFRTTDGNAEIKDRANVTSMKIPAKDFDALVAAWPKIQTPTG